MSTEVPPCQLLCQPPCQEVGPVSGGPVVYQIGSRCVYRVAAMSPPGTSRTRRARCRMPMLWPPRRGSSGGLSEDEDDGLAADLASGAHDLGTGCQRGGVAPPFAAPLGPHYRPAAPSPTTTNGAQNAGCASSLEPLSMSASMERRMASDRPTLTSRAISPTAPVISFTVASE